MKTDNCISGLSRNIECYWGVLNLMNILTRHAQSGDRLIPLHPRILFSYAEGNYVNQ